MLKQNLKLILTFCFAVFLFAGAGKTQAADIFVATTGNDSTTCGASVPCRTIEYAVEQRAKAGDWIKVKDGIYSENQIAFPLGVSLTSVARDNTKVRIQPNIEMYSGTPLITVASPTLNSDGNQEISYVSISGRAGTVKARQGIEVRNRNKVSIHHCNISDFYLDDFSTWRGTYALMVWSSEVNPTSSWEYYYSLFNSDLSKSAIYPKNAVKNFHFYENRVVKCGTGSLSGERKFDPAVVTWNLYGSSFHDNHIDVSHAQTQAITSCSALLEKVDIYNNVMVGHPIGGFPKSTTPSTSLYLVELWVLHDCKFYNNKLIRGGFSTTFGKNVEWYNNYIDTASASSPSSYFIEATFVDNASIHHNKIVCNPAWPADNMGVIVGTKSTKGYTVQADVYANIFHDVRGHVISVVSAPTEKVTARVYSNLIDHGVKWRGIHIEGPDYLEIKNNIITSNPDGIFVEKAADSLTIDSNIFFGNTRDFYGCSGTNNAFKAPTYKSYANDNFTALDSSSPQVNSGVPLDLKYRMGLGESTYWGTATSEDLPRVVLADQSADGKWEKGPYVWERDVNTLQADLNSDNKVDIFDFSILLSNFGKTNDCQNPADINNDCSVNIFDYNILSGEFGRVS